MSTNGITTAHLHHVTRNDLIKIAEAVIALARAFYTLIYVLILASLMAWWLLTGWQAQFALAIAGAMFVAYCFAAYTVPAQIEMLITDLGPASEPPGEEPQQ